MEHTVDSTHSGWYTQSMVHTVDGTQSMVPQSMVHTVDGTESMVHTVDATTVDGTQS